MQLHDPAREELKSDVIDFEAAALRIPGGLEGVRQMAPTLIVECDQQLAVIRDGLEAGDAPSVERGAHTIKGSAAVFSADLVTEAAKTIEFLARDEDLGAASASLPRLEAEVERLRDVVAGAA